MKTTNPWFKSFKPTVADNAKAKKLMKNGIAALAIGIILAFGAQAYGTSYTFTFTDGGVSATGTFGVTGGTVTSGTITVTGAALDGTFGLDPITATPPATTTVRALDGTDEIFDNQFFKGSDPVFDPNGLGFSSPLTTVGTPTTTGRANYVVNLWGNGPGNYSLFEAGQADSSGTGHVYNEYDGGTLAVSAVPDTGSTMMFFSIALAGIGWLRRKIVA
jgi:hypothetical protein